MIGFVRLLGTGQERWSGFARRRQALKHAIASLCDSFRLDPPHVAERTGRGDLDLLQGTVGGKRRPYLLQLAQRCLQLRPAARDPLRKDLIGGPAPLIIDGDRLVAGRRRKCQSSQARSSLSPRGREQCAVWATQLIQVIEYGGAFDQGLTVVEQEHRHSANGTELSKLRRLREWREWQVLEVLAENMQRYPYSADIGRIIATYKFHAATLTRVLGAPKRRSQQPPMSRDCSRRPDLGPANRAVGAVLARQATPCNPFPQQFRQDWALSSAGRG
jgi:hypothetical protein